MRICDWSSDVCSSDLSASSVTSPWTNWPRSSAYPKQPPNKPSDNDCRRYRSTMVSISSNPPCQSHIVAALCSRIKLGRNNGGTISDRSCAVVCALAVRSKIERHEGFLAYRDAVADTYRKQVTADFSFRSLPSPDLRPR